MYDFSYRFKQQLDKDQKLVTQSEIKEEFSCKEDAVTRLLAFHRIRHLLQNTSVNVSSTCKFIELFA